MAGAGALGAGAGAAPVVVDELDVGGLTAVLEIGLL
jgi:hypothetical protein